MHKYRRLLGEVLVASFFLQLFALVSPLFFQVVIDKVLVHRSMSTLDVLVIGLVTISVFESDPRRPAHLSLLAHHQPHRCRTRRAAVPPSAGAADRLFPGAPRRRFGGAGARAGEHPQFPDQLGADAGHRSVLHLRLPGGDVLLFAAADRHRAGVVPVLYRDLGRRDAAVPPPPRREIQPRRREPGLPGRERHRRRDPQGDGGRAADAAALGGAARRLCRRQLPRAQPRQRRKPERPAHQQAGDRGDALFRRQAGHRRQPDRRRTGRLQHAGRPRQRAGAAARADLAGFPPGAALDRAARRHPQHRTRADFNPSRVRCRRSAATSASSMSTFRYRIDGPRCCTTSPSPSRRARSSASSAPRARARARSPS